MANLEKQINATFAAVVEKAASDIKAAFAPVLRAHDALADFGHYLNKRMTWAEFSAKWPAEAARIEGERTAP